MADYIMRNKIHGHKMTVMGEEGKDHFLASSKKDKFNKSVWEVFKVIEGTQTLSLPKKRGRQKAREMVEEVIE